MIEHLCKIAADLADRSLRMPGVQLIMPTVLNHVVLRFGDSDQATVETVDWVQARGRVEVRATQWCNGSVMWISVRDDQLDAQARRFLSDPRAVQKGKDASTVRLSELFTRFYPADFKEAFARETGREDPDLLDALRPFAASDSPLLPAARYETMPYDWSLNRAD